MIEFQECAECMGKPQSPLCPACVHNRNVISCLHVNLKEVVQLVERLVMSSDVKVGVVRKVLMSAKEALGEQG